MGSSRTRLRAGSIVTMAPVFNCAAKLCMALTTASPMSAEIDIVREDEKPVRSGVFHDFVVWRRRLANRRPMNRLEPGVLQKLNP